MEERLLLFDAASQGNIKDVEYWLQQDGKGVFAEDDKGWPPLFHAVAANQLGNLLHVPHTSRFSEVSLTPSHSP